MQNSSIIFLIGFMGSGKSTLGKALSSSLRYAFIDMDDWIANRACKSIPEIFTSDGEKAFRQMEQECLHHLMHQEKIVVATGGGTPCFFDNMELMLELGTVVFVNPNKEVLYERLKTEQDQRPLIAGLNANDLKNKIDQTLEKRLPFYEQANITINETDTVEDLVQKLS